MKRRYWSLGSAMVVLGVWLFVARFSDSEPPAPVRASERASLPRDSFAVERRDVKPEAQVVPVPQAVRQKVEAVYASAAPQPAVDEGETPEEVSIEEQVALLRKPVIDAIRMLDVTKADKYDRMREALHDSGDSVEGWTRQAPQVFAGWALQLEGKGNADVDERSVRCYLAGCEAQVYFTSEAQYEAAAQAFRSLSESAATHGGRVQTPPKQLADGRWVAAWMMMRPDVAVE